MGSRNEVICVFCYGKYFKSSLYFHQKVCATRHNIPLVQCDYCKGQIPKPELDVHVKTRCDKAPPEEKLYNTTNEKEVLQATAAAFKSPDGRIACKVCGRKFNPDRVAKHESICVDISNKASHPAYDSKKHRMAGLEDQVKSLQTLELGVSPQIHKKKLEVEGKQQQLKICTPDKTRVNIDPNKTIVGSKLDAQSNESSAVSRKTNQTKAVTSHASGSSNMKPIARIGGPAGTFSSGRFETRKIKCFDGELNDLAGLAGNTDGGGKPRIEKSNITSPDNTLLLGWPEFKDGELL